MMTTEMGLRGRQIGKGQMVEEKHWRRRLPDKTVVGQEEGRKHDQARKLKQKGWCRYIYVLSLYIELNNS